MPDRSEIKFDKLRTKCIVASEKVSEYETKLRGTCGDARGVLWPTRTEQKKLDAMRERATAARNALFAYIQNVSPRDWSYGVPMHWVCESLAFADVIRPVNEPLSVVPPMAYGATEPRR